jgi:hypothetical protein
MKKISYLIIAVLFIFVSCENKTDDHEGERELNNNALLAKRVMMQDRIAFHNEDNPEWTSGFKHKDFIYDILEDIHKGRFTDIYSSEDTSDHLKYTSKEVMQRMGLYHNKDSVTYDQKIPMDTLYKKGLKPEELVEIIFLENWAFNKDDLRFTKQVNSWSFVRKYYRDDDTLKKEARYRKTFVVRNDETSDPTIKLADQLIYAFYSEHEFLKRVGFDKLEFFRFLIEQIKAGKIKTYDPIWLVDGSKREFTPEALSNYAGIELDAYDLDWEVYKFLFVEDWYYDMNTYNIHKEVKGLGFVAGPYNDGEWTDKILFFIFFD